MTIPVPLPQLAATLEHYDSALMATLPEDAWPRVVVVDPYVDGDELVVPAPHPVVLPYVATNPLVTLAWPPAEPHGYTLIVDGWARVEGADLRVRLDHAVLHRPEAHADGPVPAYVLTLQPEGTR